MNRISFSGAEEEPDSITLPTGQIGGLDVTRWFAGDRLWLRHAGPLLIRFKTIEYDTLWRDVGLHSMLVEDKTATPNTL